MLPSEKEHNYKYFAKLPATDLLEVHDMIFNEIKTRVLNFTPIKVEPEFKSDFKYYAHHRPSNEDWVVIGIKKNLTKVCVAGYPPTLADFSDCVDFVEAGPLSQQELDYRTKEFGENWI